MLSIFAVMNLISRHIEYLVRCNDCVIVPGWGAFIAQYKPASFDNDNNLIPPMRVLGFNSSLSHDDGLLASSISRQLEISYENATRQIAEEVGVMRYQLENQGEVALSGVGTFYKNAEASMLFEPFENSSASSCYYGLRSVKLMQILAQARKENDAMAKEDSQPQKDTIYLPIRRSWARIVASIAIVLGLGFIFSTPIINDDVHQASFSAPKISAPVKPVVKLNEPTGDEQLLLNVTNIDIADAEATVDTVSRYKYQKVRAYYKAHKEMRLKQLEEYRKQQALLIEKEGNVNYEVSNENPKNERLNVRLSDADKYCLVIASLENRAKAEEYIAKSGNENLAILEKDGRYRVYAATGESPKQTLNNARQNGLTRRYPGAWVCRK